MKGRAHCLVLSTILKVISYHPYSKAVKMKNEQNVPQITLSSFYCDKIQSGSLETTIYSFLFIDKITKHFAKLCRCEDLYYYVVEQQHVAHNYNTVDSSADVI